MDVKLNLKQFCLLAQIEPGTDLKVKQYEGSKPFIRDENLSLFVTFKKDTDMTQDLWFYPMPDGFYGEKPTNRLTGESMKFIFQCSNKAPKVAKTVGSIKAI